MHNKGKNSELHESHLYLLHLSLLHVQKKCTRGVKKGEGPGGGGADKDFPTAISIFLFQISCQFFHADLPSIISLLAASNSCLNSASNSWIRKQLVRELLTLDN